MSIDSSSDSPFWLSWCDGQSVSDPQRSLSAASPAALFGESAFETMRVDQGEVLYLEDHLDRLTTTALALGLAEEIDRSLIQSEIKNALEEIGVDRAGRLRITLMRAIDTASGLNVERCHIQRWLLYSPLLNVADEPVEICFSTVRKIPPACFDPAWKHGNYLSSLLAVREARARGFGDAILLSTEGFVTESSCANLFWIRDRELWTCSSDSVFPGLCRKRVLEVAEEMSIVVHSGHYQPEELLLADELFLSSSIRGLVAISRLEGRDYDLGFPDSLTAQLGVALKKRDQAELIRRVL
ncbi:MAG: hypothetical protein CBC13_07340 [Planctomycetia bacterium TMED53]|nr:MAG: hypothetical protein CBC13_07340 [Planctomycetia bacterium TMED53]